MHRPDLTCLAHLRTPGIHTHPTPTHTPYTRTCSAPPRYRAALASGLRPAASSLSLVLLAGGLGRRVAGGLAGGGPACAALDAALTLHVGDGTFVHNHFVTG